MALPRFDDKTGFLLASGAGISIFAMVGETASGFLNAAAGTGFDDWLRDVPAGRAPSIFNRSSVLLFCFGMDVYEICDLHSVESVLYV